MAKTRQDLHDPLEWFEDWLVTGQHWVDVSNQPFRDYHTILWCERFYFPSPMPGSPCYIPVYDRSKAQGLAIALVANPDLLMDMCLDCHWPYYRINAPRWNVIEPPPGPPRYLTWPDNHTAIVPCCMSWTDQWTWDPYADYPW